MIKELLQLQNVRQFESLSVIIRTKRNAIKFVTSVRETAKLASRFHKGNLNFERFARWENIVNVVNQLLALEEDKVISNLPEETAPAVDALDVITDILDIEEPEKELLTMNEIDSTFGEGNKANDDR